MADHSYWRQIEQYFVKKRGSALMLSPKDWPLINSWEQQGIPLEVIYKGIDDAFTHFEATHLQPQPRTIRSLVYCKHAVEKAWNDRKEEQRISPDIVENPSGPDVERQKLIVKLRSSASQLQRLSQKPGYHQICAELLSVSEDLKPFIARVEQAGDSDSLAQIKDELRAMEQQLILQQAEALEPEVRRQLYAAAETRLASHKSNMREAVYQETLRLAFIQELHTRFPLPSLL